MHNNIKYAPFKPEVQWVHYTVHSGCGEPEHSCEIPSVSFHETLKSPFLAIPLTHKAFILSCEGGRLFTQCPFWNPISCCFLSKRKWNNLVQQSNVIACLEINQHVKWTVDESKYYQTVKVAVMTVSSADRSSNSLSEQKCSSTHSTVSMATTCRTRNSSPVYLGIPPLM